MKINSHKFFAAFAIAVVVAASWPVLTVMNSKRVAAEDSCPAGIPTSQMIIRSGGPSGAVLGTYTNDGWGYDENGNPTGVPPTSASLTVPSGTVIYYSSNTNGVEPVNRSPGSQHSISGAATVLTPSDKAGYYPNGYYFSKQASVTGQTNPLSSSIWISVAGHNSCWGGFEDGQTQISLRINVQGSPPAPATRQATSSLAIVKNPSVSLLVNGSTSATIPRGSSANFTWATDSVNIGNSCQASNNNSDSTWSGPKVGQASYTPPQSPPPSGGSQTVGPFPTDGTYTYSIICFGLNGVVSEASTVQVNVGEPPSYTCSALPGSQTVIRGSNGGASIDVTPANGYNSPVIFSLGSISPSSGTPPTVTVDSTPQTSPYDTNTAAVIATTGSTSVGTYSITFTGTGGVNCPPITFTVIDPTPDADIYCDGLEACTKSVGESSQITWDSDDVTSCQVSNNPPVVRWTGTSGSQSTGALSATVTYHLNCDGPYGEAKDSVTITVIGSIDAPTNVTGNNSVCGQITVNWDPPASGSTPTAYKVYRRNQGDAGNGNLLYTTSNGTQFSYTDTSGTANSFYEYGVSALYDDVESSIVWSPPISVLPCTASFNGSYKKIVGAGNTAPTPQAINECSGAGGGFTLPSGQIFQSGDTVYFEICVRNGGTVALSSVSVTEIVGQDRNLQDVEIVRANENCASGSGSGPYTIGSMNPGAACSLIVKARISDPGGPASSLHYFQNFAQLTSAQVSAMVNTLPEAFIIGSGIPDRREIPR